MGIKRSVSGRVRRLLTSGGVALATLAAVGGTTLATAPSASAAGTYCYVSSDGGCDLFAGMNVNEYYFVTPGSIPAGMLCWADGPWTDLNYWTNRWFKMKSAAYGIFWAPASEVMNQIGTPHC